MAQEKLNSTRDLVVLANDINYLNKLESGDFPFTEASKRIETVKRLRIVFNNLCEQYKNELSNKKSEKKLKALLKQMRRCSLYIVQLMEGHSAVWSNYENATRYLGMTHVAPEIVQAMMISLNQGDNGITTVEDYIGALNAQRSAHTWGFGFIGTILQKLPGEFATPVAAQPYTGPLSFMLYFTRLAIEFRLLYQNSQTRSEFQTQWAQRKFVILNDFIWGFANLASYVCLTILRLKNLGSIGNADVFFNTLNVGLMVVDFMLVMLRFHEAQTKHNAESASYDEKLDPDQPGSIEHGQLAKRKAQCEADWKYQQLKFLNQGAYNIAMIAGFALMTGLSAGMLPLVGAAVCFFFSTASSVFDGIIDIMQMKASIRNATDEYTDLSRKFDDKLDETTKKLLYLEMKKSVATTGYQENLISFQQKKLIINGFLKALAPALVFGAFAFLSFGIGLAAVAASLALALTIHVVLKQNEPKEEVLPELDEGEYTAFILGGMTRELLIEQLKTPQVNHTKVWSFFTNDQDVGPLTEDELSPPNPV